MEQFDQLLTISGKWLLGPTLCDMWTSADVLCCSASILHLLAVAVDRFWAVTNIEYIRGRNKTRINTMILLVWLVAAMVSIAPLLGWKDPDFLNRIEQGQCMVSQDVGYQLFATCATFYVPLFFILLFYWKIWQAARNRIRHRVGKITKTDRPTSTAMTLTTTNTSISTATMPQTKLPMSTTFSTTDELSCHTGTIELSSPMVEQAKNSFEHDETADPESGMLGEPSGSSDNDNQTIAHDCSPSSSTPVPNTSSSQTNLTPTTTVPTISSVVQAGEGKSLKSKNNTNAIHSSKAPAGLNATTRANKDLKKKESIENKRERKAARTLAIITGAFFCCWFPFFLMVLTETLCSSCGPVPEILTYLLLWLGYFNSTLNPIIYTIFSPEFRQAFKRILCGSKAARRR